MSRVFGDPYIGTILFEDEERKNKVSSKISDVHFDSSLRIAAAVTEPDVDL